MESSAVLYKRDARGNIIRWEILMIDASTISVSHGIFGHTPHTERIKLTMKKANEVESRIKAKRKEGYKSLEDLYDNAPCRIENNADLHAYLQTYLPKYNTTSEGFVLPMLAKTLEDNTPFEKFGSMLGQWKINGLRCIIGAEKVEGDLFKQYRFTYTSREGTRWNLPWMDDIISDRLFGNLLEMMLEEGVCLDGELYLPGYTVNDINSFVKNPSLPQHYKLQYWCYDLALENSSALSRYEMLTSNCITSSNEIYDKDTHLNNTNQFFVLPTYRIGSISRAINERDDFIRLGFEGLILRNPEAEYAFGKRNSAMYKFKKKEDGMFEIIQIKEDKRGLPIFVLKNDINEEYFECTINLPQDKQREQLTIKDMLIGKKGLVEYRERSGVKQVPFHAKLIKIYL